MDIDSIPTAEKIEFEHLLTFFKDLKNKQVLDLGCGTGRIGLKLAKYAKEVVGIDISNKSIDIANRTAKKNGLKNFKAIVNDFKSVKYKERFDYIIAVNMLHHTDDIDDILQHIKMALKKNGVFIIFEFNPLNLLFLPFLAMNGQLQSHLNWNYFRSNIFTLKPILEKNEFSRVQINRYAFLPTMLYNYSLNFKIINEILTRIPGIRIFSAFHIIECFK